MTTRTTSRREAGLTLLEVMIAMFILVLLAGLLLPGLTKTKSPARRINCISNLKQIGLAARMWATDHGDQFPWQVSTVTNGTLEFAASPDVFRHFQAVSNELNSSKVLVCPTDPQRVKEIDWGKVGNRNLSYFVGLEADEARPQSILSGDRNLTGGVAAVNGVMKFDTKSPAGFSPDLHKNVGNLALGDGSGQQVTSSSLRKQIQAALEQTGQPALRLAIPQ